MIACAHVQIYNQAVCNYMAVKQKHNMALRHMWGKSSWSKGATAGTHVLFQAVSHQQRDFLKGVGLSENSLTEAKRWACQGIIRAGGSNLQQYQCTTEVEGQKATQKTNKRLEV